MAYERPVLSPDEAAAIAVFDPQGVRNLDDLHGIVNRAIEVSGTAGLDERFAAILNQWRSGTSREGPWTRQPLYADGVLVLRLRQNWTGNVAPWLRQKAVADGLAALDLLTDLVFAATDIQSRFDRPEWCPPSRHHLSNNWMHVGAFVTHLKFGAGRVLHIGKYKNRQVIVILFSDGERVLDLEGGSPYIRAVLSTNP